MNKTEQKICWQCSHYHPDVAKPYRGFCDLLKRETWEFDYCLKEDTYHA